MRFYILYIFGFLAINITWDVQVVLVLFYLSHRNGTRIFGDFCLFIEYIHNLVYILLTQAVLIAIFYKTFAGIDNENTFFGVIGILFINYNDTGRNASAIK